VLDEFTDVAWPCKNHAYPAKPSAFLAADATVPVDLRTINLPMFSSDYIESAA
jgi:hypothetical protein